MNDFITSNGGIVATVIVTMLTVNAILSGLKKGIDLVKDKTKTTVDDQVSDTLGKVLGISGKIVDFFSSNVEHK